MSQKNIVEISWKFAILKYNQKSKEWILCEQDTLNYIETNNLKWYANSKFENWI